MQAIQQRMHDERALGTQAYLFQRVLRALQAAIGTGQLAALFLYQPVQLKGQRCQ